ncbi:hypothetical protein FJR39_08865 [Dolichospermum flos-aquae UHCC 0037]|uniref:Uncharacterized protein n=1 Tax=Dolichospermum flos-aquae UHCC 0037 TaxID=2590026 RepID=A0ACC7S748_DOLFA|nr:hypothetical protein [Anabaena sp. 54]MTJ43322.1 hypothetical protein [Dolichospermum flos-aquae UHCC 0037]
MFNEEIILGTSSLKNDSTVGYQLAISAALAPITQSTPFASSTPINQSIFSPRAALA